MKQFTYTKRRPKSAPVTRHAAYCIDHVSTGKRILGYSTQADKEVDKQLESLAAGKHRSRKLQRLFDHDDEVIVYLYPTNSLKEAKKISTEQREAIPDHYSYLLLN